MSRLVIKLLILLLASSATIAGITPISADGKSISLAPMLEKVTPAVVNISVVSSSSLSSNPLFNDPFFRDFFKNFTTTKPQRSAGSGVIIDARNGVIVTNHHVIAKAKTIKVTLKDRRVFNARLIGVDPRTDIAVIAIPPNNLLSISLGDSDKVEVGDFVAAIGNPFGIGQTVTSGIVSALGRSGLNVRQFEDFIQTDAAINPGNSGGALVNMKGQLIGINSNIISPAGASAGIGFAIPVNMMKAVVKQIRKFGKVIRGTFGIEVQDLTPQLADTLGVGDGEGAVITHIEPGSAATRSGLKTGDTVVALNGAPIRSSNHLRSQMALITPGTPIRLRIWRDGRTRNINAKIGSKHSQKSLQKPLRPSIKRRSQNSLPMPEFGITVDERNNEVIITHVAKNTPAYAMGLRPGDRILSINGMAIEKAKDIPLLDASSIDIQIQRGVATIRFIRR